MYWNLSALSASSPVESILDKENFTLEELLVEEEVIQECKALNSRLINFLRDRAQIVQLLRYIVEEPPQDADNKRVFRFPFIASEIFACEIDVILQTLMEEEELMNLLFSFLEPNRPHGDFLAGYFSKVVICLMTRKTDLMNYVQAHQKVIGHLVDLIGITSIMEVLVHLVGTDDHANPSFAHVMQWLADSNLLEMIVDKLNPSSPPEVQANAAETLGAITRNASSALAMKLSSPSFVARIFDHALEDSHLKSGLVHSLSVCVSLLDPRRSAASSHLFYSFSGQNMFEFPVPVNQDTIGAMLPKLGDLLMLLNLSSDCTVLHTTYGQLRPPLGKHRLKIVEFIAVLLRTGNEDAEKELISSGTIQRILDLFFEYPFNNALHHHVESIIMSSLESNNNSLVDYILRECNLIEKILQTDKDPFLSGEIQPTLLASGKRPPRSGNIGHITRISNKIVQLADINGQIKTCLQENSEWNEWQLHVLQQRNIVENVYKWGCGRPTTLQDRARDSYEDAHNDRDYDVAALASNLSQAFGYNLYGSNENEEDTGTFDRDDADAYFDKELAEPEISSLRLGDNQKSLFTNSNWFTYQEDGSDNTITTDMMDDINLNATSNTGNGSSSSDDEVVVGEDEELTPKSDDEMSTNNTSTSNPNTFQDSEEVISSHVKNLNPEFSILDPQERTQWEEPSIIQVSGSGLNPYIDNEDDPVVTNVDMPTVDAESESPIPNGFPTSRDESLTTNGWNTSLPAPSLFEEDVEFVGVDPEGTDKAREQPIKEGIVLESQPSNKNNDVLMVPVNQSSDENSGIKEFNDANYWRIDPEMVVLE